MSSHPEGSFDGTDGTVTGPETTRQVVNSDAALRCLNTCEYARWVALHPDGAYVIEFPENRCAQLTLSGTLWKALTQAADQHTVEVMPYTSVTRWRPWSGGPNDLRVFKSIRIRKLAQ
jgi:hypothetical protein